MEGLTWSEGRRENWNFGYVRSRQQQSEDFVVLAFFELTSVVVQLECGLVLACEARYSATNLFVLSRVLSV